MRYGSLFKFLPIVLVLGTTQGMFSQEEGLAIIKTPSFYDPVYTFVNDKPDLYLSQEVYGFTEHRIENQRIVSLCTQLPRVQQGQHTINLDLLPSDCHENTYFYLRRQLEEGETESAVTASIPLLSENAIHPTTTVMITYSLFNKSSIELYQDSVESYGQLPEFVLNQEFAPVYQKETRFISRVFYVYLLWYYMSIHGFDETNLNLLDGIIELLFWEEDLQIRTLSTLDNRIQNLAQRNLGQDADVQIPFLKHYAQIIARLISLEGTDVIPQSIKENVLEHYNQITQSPSLNSIESFVTIYYTLDRIKNIMENNDIADLNELMEEFKFRSLIVE